MPRRRGSDPGNVLPFSRPPNRERTLERPVWIISEHISYADCEANMRILRDAGVPILAGTDSDGSSAVGATLLEELQLMVKESNGAHSRRYVGTGWRYG